jgi:hypothetical protein
VVPILQGTNAAAQVNSYSVLSPTGVSQLQAVSEAVAPGQPTLSCSVMAGGVLQLSIAGQPLQRFMIEVSDDLAHWSDLAASSVQDGTATIATPMSAGPQFYRARLLDAR